VLSASRPYSSAIANASKHITKKRNGMASI